MARGVAFLLAPSAYPEGWGKLWGQGSGTGVEERRARRSPEGAVTVAICASSPWAPLEVGRHEGGNTIQGET